MARWFILEAEAFSANGNPSRALAVPEAYSFALQCRVYGAGAVVCPSTILLRFNRSIDVRDPAFAKLAWHGGEVVTQESAKLPCAGSIPARASRVCQAKCGTEQLYARVYTGNFRKKIFMCSIPARASEDMNTTIQGIVFMTMSTFLYAIFNPLLKKAGLNPYATLFVQLGFSWLFGLPFLFATGSYRGMTWASILMLAFAALLGTFAYLLTVKSFSLLPMWQITMFNVTTPVLVAFVSYFLLGESLSSKMFVSVLFMGIGLFIAFH